MGVVFFIEIEVCYVGETRFNGSGLGSMLDLLFFFGYCCNVKRGIVQLFFLSLE